MSKKKAVPKKADREYVPTDVKIGLAYKKNFHIPMCGYHQNYTDFTAGKLKGTAVFVGTTLGVSIDSEHSFTFDVKDLISLCVDRVKKAKKGKKK